MTPNRLRELEAAQNADRRLLRPDELASLLGIPLATIYRWRSRGERMSGFPLNFGVDLMAIYS